MSFTNPDLQLVKSEEDEQGVVQRQTHADPSTGVTMLTQRAPDGVMRQSFSHPRCPGQFDRYDTLRDAVEALPPEDAGDKAVKAKAK
jgi:hypothetical protein